MNSFCQTPANQSNLSLTLHEKLDLLFFLSVSKMRSNIITFLTTHLMRIKYVTPLHIPLTRIKSEFKCINNFDPTFDACQIETLTPPMTCIKGGSNI